ncbi:MAG: acyltransferase [Calothrix sp. FI2-JRJ7]|nr:acyltransferase [Calothrix sp. FI2-JRJ7]
MNTERDKSLDALKAISIIFVLFWHLQPIKFVISTNTHVLINIADQIVKNFELQLSLTAVPIFYIVSLYLYFQKKPSIKYFQKRILNLIKIFVFWQVIQNIFFVLVTKQAPPLCWDNIMGAKPDLPLVGGSVFYFLFDLIILIIIAFIYQLINSDTAKKLINFVIIVFSIAYFEFLYIQKLNLPHYDLRNFIIYIPIAFAFANYKNQIIKFKFIFLLLYILFSIHDIYLRADDYPLSIYARISIVCGALTIFCFTYTSKIKGNSLLQTIAKYTLGLFAFHKYWQCLFLLLIKSLGLDNSNILFSEINLNIVYIIQAIIVILETIFSIYLFKLVGLSKFVS